MTPQLTVGRLLERMRDAARSSSTSSGPTGSIA